MREANLSQAAARENSVDGVVAEVSSEVAFWELHFFILSFIFLFN